MNKGILTVALLTGLIFVQQSQAFYGGWGWGPGFGWGYGPYYGGYGRGAAIAAGVGAGLGLLGTAIAASEARKSGYYDDNYYRDSDSNVRYSTF